MINSDQNSLRDFLFTQTAPPVIVCIGSPKVTGDCYGPLTGQLLCDFCQIPTFVYGTVLSPITALNLPDTLSFVRRKHKGSKIIAVDAAISEHANLSRLCFKAGSLSPGLAVGKSLPDIGDFSITAVTARCVVELPKVPLRLVYKCALRTARAISELFYVRRFNQSPTPKLYYINR